MLIEMEQPILLISERLGHESVQTTWDTYAHLYPNKGIQLAEALEGVNLSGDLTAARPRSSEEKQADLLSLIEELTPELQTMVSEKLSAYSAGNIGEEEPEKPTAYKNAERVK